MASVNIYACPECGEKHDLSRYTDKIESGGIIKGALICKRGEPGEHVTVIHLDSRGNVRRSYSYDMVPENSIQTRGDQTVLKLLGEDEEIIFISSEELGSDQNLALGKLFYGMDKSSKKEAKVKISIWSKN